MIIGILPLKPIGIPDTIMREKGREEGGRTLKCVEHQQQEDAGFILPRHFKEGLCVLYSIAVFTFIALRFQEICGGV
jgi:hypothetical protein